MRSRFHLGFFKSMIGLLFGVILINSACAKETVDVIIVGAGLAGLSTAYRLQKAGLTYKILEMSPHIGGRIRTASYPEQISAEVGLEEFWEDNPTVDIIRELKLPVEKAASAFSSFVSQGKLLPFVQNTSAGFLASQFSERDLKLFQKWDQRMVHSYQRILQNHRDPEMSALKNISFSNWMKKESGLSAKLQNFVRIQSEPEYGTSWTQISALEGVAEWHIFSGPGLSSYHVDGGNQKLVNALADQIGNKNIRVNTKASFIQSQPNEVKVTATDLSNFQETEYHGRYVVTTVPLFRLREIQFDPPLTPLQNQAIQTQTWGSYFTAHVKLDPAASQFWTVRGQSILPVLTDGSLGVIYGGSAAVRESGTILLNLLVTGGSAESFNLRTGSADQIRIELTQSLQKLWPGIEKWIKSFEFYPYHPRAIASWPVGRSRFDELSDEMRKPFGRVYFAGDFTEGTHSNGAAESAIRVVRGIVDRRKSEK